MGEPHVVNSYVFAIVKILAPAEESDFFIALVLPIFSYSRRRNTTVDGNTVSRTRTDVTLTLLRIKFSHEIPVLDGLFFVTFGGIIRSYMSTYYITCFCAD